MIIMAREIGTNERKIYHSVSYIGDTDIMGFSLIILLHNDDKHYTSKFYSDEPYIGQLIETKLLNNENFVILYRTVNSHWVVENIL